MLAERDGCVLRTALDIDLPAIDELTIACYRPILESYVSMLGEECYAAVRHDPELTWEERKTRQNRDLYARHPEGLDDAHIPARRAYEAVGFDRPVPGVEYWQDLSERVD